MGEILKRSQVPVSDTWNTKDLFHTPQDWEEAYAQVDAKIAQLSAYQGKLGESAALLFTAGAGKLLASNVLDAYFSSGATLSVGLYMYAFEEGKYDVSYAIGAVLLVLVLIINICAKLSKKMLKPKV